MKSLAFVLVVLLTAALLLAAYDVWLKLRGRPTISEDFRGLSPLAVAAVCLVWGLLTGALAMHFWGPSWR